MHNNGNDCKCNMIAHHCSISYVLPVYDICVKSTSTFTVRKFMDLTTTHNIIHKIHTKCDFKNRNTIITIHNWRKTRLWRSDKL